MLPLIQLACFAGTLGNVYDVLMPKYRSSCSNGCLAWSTAGESLANLTQADVDAMFVDGSSGMMMIAQDHCAMPGARSGMHEQDCGLHCHDGIDQWSYIYDSYAGPWCFCKDPVRSLEEEEEKKKNDPI